MKTRIVKLATGTVTTTVAAAATTTILRNAIITGVTWVFTPTAWTSGGYQRAELSFQSTTLLGVNETLAVISGPSFGGVCATSGMPSGVLFCDLGLAVPVNVGDKLYLHIGQNGTCSGIWDCYLHLSE